MDDYDREIYKKALALWGEDAQIKMVIEECAELIVALVKLNRNRNNSTKDEVIDEIVDVWIMIEQAMIIFGETSCWNRKEYKLAKLEERLLGE